MASYNIYAGTSFSLWSYYSSNGLHFEQDIPKDSIIKSITLHCIKFTNNNYKLVTQNNTFAKGSINSNGTVTLKLYIKNSDGTKTYTNSQEIVTKGELYDKSITPDRQYYYYTTAYVKETSNAVYKDYTFTFPSNTAVTSSTIVYLEVSGRGMSTGSGPDGLAIRKGTNGLKGTAEIVDAPPTGPTSISISDTWITDLSGKAKGNGINKTSTEDLTVTVSGGSIASASFSGNSLVKCSFISPNKVSVTALKSNTDYPSKDKITMSVNGGASDTFTVNFYEKPSITLDSNQYLNLNIRTAIGKGFSVSGYKNDSGAISKTKIFNNSYSDFAFSDVSSLKIDSNFINLDSNNGIFKIEDEGGSYKTLIWRFYNSQVQEKTVSDNYCKNITTYVRWYATPAIKDQLSYSWVDIDGNVTTDVPNVILIEQNSPMVGNLVYTNAAVSGGYCRGFRVQYINENNVIRRTDYFDANIDLNGQASTSGRVLHKYNLTDIPTGELLTIKITAYFYFNDSKATRYYGASITVPQKLLRIKDSDLLPTKIFPETVTTSPYTPMMLPDVERFGYSLSDLFFSINEFVESDFGLLINGQEISIKTAPSYFSSYNLTKNIVVDVGKYVKDNEINMTQCTIKPYIDLYYGTEYVKRISITDNIALPNAVIDTSLATIWERPVIEKGKLATYFDYDRFMKFINKYRVLYNNQILSVPTNKQGDIINTDFWVNIANKLDTYAQNMQDWATDVTNFVVVWALPEFKHKKGEIITNNNLYQNYYDLLIQHSGYESFATHDYLHDSNYTHNDLNHYTHNEITNKEGI